MMHLYTDKTGFTLLETVTALIIFAAIALGMTYTFSEIQTYFRQQTYFEDVDHYGNTVLDMVADSLMLAKDITLTSRNGYSVIEMTLSHRGKDNTIVYTHPTFFANAEKGVLLNDAPPWRFKSFETPTVEYHLDDFWCESMPGSLGNHSQALSKVRRSTYIVSLAITLKMQRKSTVTQKIFKFRRKVFAANDFL